MFKELAEVGVLDNSVFKSLEEAAEKAIELGYYFPADNKIKYEKALAFTSCLVEVKPKNYLSKTTADQRKEAFDQAITTESEEINCEDLSTTKKQLSAYFFVTENEINDTFLQRIHKDAAATEEGQEIIQKSGGMRFNFANSDFMNTDRFVIGVPLASELRNTSDVKDFFSAQDQQRDELLTKLSEISYKNPETVQQRADLKRNLNEFVEHMLKN